MFLFGFWQSCQAVDLLIDKYPVVPGADTPSKENTDLPSIINYIYRFALLACGIVAFVSILIGAVRYIFSAGNATIAGDAKDQITQALLGVLILLASVLILRTINPDLVNLNLSLQPTTQEATFKGCFATQCISNCKPLCSTPDKAYCTIPLDAGVCPSGQNACYCSP